MVRIAIAQRLPVCFEGGSEQGSADGTVRCLQSRAESGGETVHSAQTGVREAQPAEEADEGQDPPELLRRNPSRHSRRAAATGPSASCRLGPARR